jgi:hypothetical protein
MENSSIMYSVKIITDNDTFSFSERDRQIFNNLFYFFADAEIITSSIKRNGNETSFMLEEQTQDVSFHNFTKDKIIRSLELIKERYGFNFDFSVVEIENTPSRRTQNSRRTRGGKKSRRKTRRNRRSKSSKTKQKRY